MSKSTQSYPWLTSKPNSAKTIVERAKREVPDFAKHYAKFEQQTTMMYLHVAQIDRIKAHSPLDILYKEV